MLLSKSKEKRALKFPIHSWPFCLRELILFTSLSCIFCTFPVTDTSHHPERQFSLRVTLFHSQWHTFFSTALEQHKHLAAFSRLSYSYLVPQLELGFFLVTAFFTFSLFFSKLHITYTSFLSHVINSSSVTFIPRPFCAPHQLLSHLNLSSLIRTQALSCQLYHLFSFSLLFSYLKNPILGHASACFFL